MLVAARSVLLLRSLLPRAWSPMARAWLTVAMSVIVFCPAGLWNFSRGMSGTAWLTANLFALVAIVLATRRRTVLRGRALPRGASYGTGFGAFVAIAVVAPCTAGPVARGWCRSRVLAVGAAGRPDVHQPRRRRPAAG